MEFIREAYSSGKVHSFFPVLVDPSGSANPPLTGSKTHSLYAGTDDQKLFFCQTGQHPLALQVLIWLTRAHARAFWSNKQDAYLPKSYLVSCCYFNVLRCLGTNGPGAAVNTSKRDLFEWR